MSLNQLGRLVFLPARVICQSCFQDGYSNLATVGGQSIVIIITGLATASQYQAVAVGGRMDEIHWANNHWNITVIREMHVWQTARTQHLTWFFSRGTYTWNTTILELTQRMHKDKLCFSDLWNTPFLFKHVSMLAFFCWPTRRPLRWPAQQRLMVAYWVPRPRSTSRDGLSIHLPRRRPEGISGRFPKKTEGMFLPSAPSVGKSQHFGNKWKTNKANGTGVHCILAVARSC